MRLFAYLNLNKIIFNANKIKINDQTFKLPTSSKAKITWKLTFHQYNLYPPILKITAAVNRIYRLFDTVPLE